VKRSQPRRDWSDVDVIADDPCLVCGLQGRTERAHVSGRKYDQPKPGRKTLWVNPLDIVPLCGPATDSKSCHHRFDAGELDLLDHLDPARQLRCVEVLGTIEAARVRLSPGDYHRHINAARVEVRIAA
jgi:hypothetical protein